MEPKYFILIMSLVSVSVAVIILIAVVVHSMRPTRTGTKKVKPTPKNYEPKVMKMFFKNKI